MPHDPRFREAIKEAATHAIAVSQSGCAVRSYQRREVMLRVEPLRQAMKWKEFEYEPRGEDE